MVKVASKGTQLQLFYAAAFATLAQVIDISGPGPEVGTYDATALDSGVGKEKEPTGYVEGGTLSFSMFMDPVLAGFQALTDLISTPAVAQWKIIYPDVGATEWTFDGILKTVSPTVNMDDGLKADGEVEVDGIVVYPT